MSLLPDSYASPQHLAFNHTALKRRFRFSPPDADPGGSGFQLLLRRGELLVQGEGRESQLPEDGLLGPSGGKPLYLGQWDGRPCRLQVLPGETPLPSGVTGRNLLAQDPQLPIDLLSLGGLARQLSHWEHNSRFCSACGAGMQRLPGEWGLVCDGCGAHHFPHIHPCVIVLILRPGEVLLTRKAEWAPGRYSLVAGFLDVGECLEEAVAREVREETGVEVDQVRYIGSQCWPFPSQLMTGFVARYTGGEVCVQEDELEDARWFAVDDLPNLPPKRSIARYLIDNHLNEAG